ncbi:SusC/RagA family TonB-linked outer membrane protein [Echinicola marina]|uniref:SusC/RagA family TonB-linked outer membrane protein n=1 Tax=Echinicola marina TaxID=2859768 RepID=UPI001CF65E4D|nr:SusC/RagA family TonB-linked outer membrane protein [Echinicola marina]UCS94033.1 SusC/RagA family TonB-linked outer membrane protein [Echinicola marina]
MKLKKIIYIFFAFLIIPCLTVEAQKGNGKKTIRTVAAQVVDSEGEALSAQVYSSEKRRVVGTNAEGHFTFKVPEGDILVIRSEGYHAKTLEISNDEVISGKIVLTKAPAFSGENHILYTPFDSTSERRSVGSYSVVKGEELESNPTLSLENALGGRLTGLWQWQGNMVPGWTSQNLSAVSPAWGGYVVIVDGVERPLDFLEPEIIESVQLLKDATFKSMYGGTQANGILLVKTKRGKVNRNGIRLNFQRGVHIPTRLPKYLNSYDYARYYNQALANDGFAPLYTEADLSAYRTGNSPYLYPDVDYYDEFLNKSMDITRMSTQMTGGNKDARYFAHLGYQSNGGLEKYTEYPHSEDIVTLRTNVDLNLKDFITLNAGFNGALQMRKTPNVSAADIIQSLSTLRPNEFPIRIPAELAGVVNREFVLGGTAEKQNNPYGLLTGRGYSERKASYIQSDLGLNVDLGQWVKGLSIRPFVTFDIYNVETATKAQTFAVYEPYMGEDDTINFQQWGEYSRQTGQSRSLAEVTRRFAVNFKSSYLRTFGEHSIKAYLNVFQSQLEVRNVHQNPRRQNFGTHLNYMYKNRYIAEIDVNTVGVNTFSPENRYGTFPAFGLGWILSEESFMKEVSFLDYLKLRGSYGILGSTGQYANGGFFADLYQDRWVSNGTYNGIGGDNYRLTLDHTGNPDLSFQKSYELNAGFDALLFKESTLLSFGYFNHKHTGLFSTLDNMIPGVIGRNEALPYVNHNEVKVFGLEGQIEHSRRIGKLKVSVGGNVTYSVARNVKPNEANFPAETHAGLIRKGTEIGSIFGYQSVGTFTDQEDIDNSPLQLTGNVRPGDLKYEDTNGDGVVDQRDQVVIGNSTPKLFYGVFLKLSYKGFNLDAYGMGNGMYKRLFDNSYYQIYGNRKYSAAVLTGLPNGNPHPQLSTILADNNFVNSSYWIGDGSYFKLRNVELGYTFSPDRISFLGLGGLKVFARGFNLLTLSKVKDMDPENIGAGIFNFPLATTITGGASISF